MRIAIPLVIAVFFVSGFFQMEPSDKTASASGTVFAGVYTPPKDLLGGGGKGKGDKKTKDAGAKGGGGGKGSKNGKGGASGSVDSVVDELQPNVRPIPTAKCLACKGLEAKLVEAWANWEKARAAANKAFDGAGGTEADAHDVQAAKHEKNAKDIKAKIDATPSDAPFPSKLMGQGLTASKKAAKARARAKKARERAEASKSYKKAFQDLLDAIDAAFSIEDALNDCNKKHCAKTSTGITDDGDTGLTEDDDTGLDDSDESGTDGEDSGVSFGDEEDGVDGGGDDGGGR